MPIHKRTDKLGRNYYWDTDIKKRVSAVKWRQQRRYKAISSVPETPYEEQYYNQTVITGAEEYVFRKKRWRIFITYKGKSVRITQRNILWLSLFINELLDEYFQLAVQAFIPSPHVIFFVDVYSKNKVFNIKMDETEFIGIPADTLPIDQLFKTYFERKI